MFEYVKDLGLAPARPYTKRKQTNLIILHHFASDATPEQVYQYHLGRGHKGIDYNVIVLLDGTAVWGRGLPYEGGHVLNSGKSAGMNARSIGIACQGNFEKRKMPAAQKTTLFRIIMDCLQKYPDINMILGHKEVKATVCPGRYFPLTEAKGLLHDPGAVETPPTEIYRVRKKWKSAKSQIGAFTSLANAKALADKHADYHVYDSDGKDVYSSTAMSKPAPKFKLKRMLQYGSKGDDVAAVQLVLKQLGYFKYFRCTGKFASITRAAVKAFQRAHGLKIDGIVGSKTTAALGGVWAA